MKKIILTSFLVVVCSLLSFAQTKNTTANSKKISLNGIWIPQVEKEKKPNGDSKDWTNVIIEQGEQNIKFTLNYPQDSKSPNQEFRFFTDDRGEENKGTVYYFFIANGKSADEAVKSKTMWENNELVTVHRMVVSDTPVIFSCDLTMRWKLSEDGKILNRTMKMSNYSAIYSELTKEGKTTSRELPVSGMTDKEFQDNYVLLEVKK